MNTKFFTALFSALILCLPSVSQTNILPDNPNIQYIGRLDRTDPLSPKISWTGTEIIANFEGTSLKMVMKSAPDTYYNVTIDGALYVIPLKEGNITYTLCSGLADTVHNVVLFKRDSPWNPQNFNGFILDNGKKLVAPPLRKIRKIEFYGDSQTQGAQVEVPGLGPDLGPLSYDNNYFSYAAITARELNAEYSCIAECGASLTPYPIRKYLSDYYDKTGMGKDYQVWDFHSWQADIVCINLGVNDDPLPADFSARYVSFVQKIRGNYPNAHIFLLAGPLFNDPALKKAIGEAVHKLNLLGDSKVCYYCFNTTVKHEGHNRTFENQACADELVAEIKKVIW
jgi:hypothetical protein